MDNYLNASPFLLYIEAGKLILNNQTLSTKGLQPCMELEN